MADGYSPPRSTAEGGDDEAGEEHSEDEESVIYHTLLRLIYCIEWFQEWPTYHGGTQLMIASVVGFLSKPEIEVGLLDSLHDLLDGDRTQLDELAAELVAIQAHMQRRLQPESPPPSLSGARLGEVIRYVVTTEEEGLDHEGSIRPPPAAVEPGDELASELTAAVAQQPHPPRQPSVTEAYAAVVHDACHRLLQPSSTEPPTESELIGLYARVAGTSQRYSRMTTKEMHSILTLEERLRDLTLSAVRNAQSKARSRNDEWLSMRAVPGASSARHRQCRARVALGASSAGRGQRGSMSADAGVGV